MLSRDRTKIAAGLLLSLCFSDFLAGRAMAVEAKSEGKDQVLRHAVFFKFKDGTSKEEVKKVVDAFRALPGKIAEIRGFELGETLPNSERNDGLTHCFLLTFGDEKGRDAYLPHPSHKEFGGVLRPHLDKVFVIDFWGQPQEKLPKKALRHAVFFKFKEGTSEEAVKNIEEGLAALPAKIDAIKSFEWGKNNSPEKHDQGFTHCFMFTLDSEKSLKQYMEDEAHVEVVRELLPILEKVRVMDYYAEEVPVKK
jgi:hypothetical protein